MNILTRLLPFEKAKKVALTISIAVMWSTSYNSLMSRSNDDVMIIEKVKLIVKEKLPGFASRYFNDKMSKMMPRSLYGYAHDLTAFFDYLGTRSFDIGKMILRDLDRITPQIIEDYLEFSRNPTGKSSVKKRSSCAVARRYSVLSNDTNFQMLDYVVNGDTVPAP